ncbi:MAG TPA: GNAT family N-acetyltransferase [Jiangellaceae bacterium]
MTELTVRPMTAAEVNAYIDYVARGYVEQRTELGGEPRDVAERHAAEAIERLFPDRRPAAGQHLYAAVVGSQVVGSLWLSEQSHGGPDGQGWVYDLEVAASYRGKGYGRALMQAAERLAREYGCSSLALNVFGGNEVAIKLYSSLGYRTTSQQMTKQL